MSKFILAALIISAFFLFVALPPLKAEKLNTIKHFGKVDENLYRGGQPSHAELETLKAMGIKRIINFRYEKDLIAKERVQAEALGLEYVSLPWAIFANYNHSVFTQFLAAIKDKDEKPTFFHCKRGSERTGVAAAVYQIATHNVSVDDAFQDAKKYNLLFYWKPFVKKTINAFYQQTAPHNA